MQGCVGVSARAARKFLSFESVYSIFLFKSAQKRGFFLGIGELLDFFFGLSNFSLGWKNFLWVELFGGGSQPKEFFLWVQTLKKHCPPVRNVSCLCLFEDGWDKGSFSWDVRMIDG